MKRREFISLLGGAAAAWPITTRAQQPAMPVVGVLGGHTRAQWQPFVAAFHQGLKEAGYAEGESGVLQLSRKPGCEVYTKCPDTHPKRGHLGSSSKSALHTRERARRRRGLVHSSAGRSQSRLQTMYQLPSHQLRRRRRHHSLQPQSGVYTPDPDFL
jgi:hypothetical protein